ncbi:MAG: DISARM system SNF2-like helicase DrmD [Candidatus Obscuribacterales bacterium]|nr:DISARM system SNF2-like helicase DrmD [Candidatus Obscuribacterales bacterium]
MSTVTVPEVGQLVDVRQRRFVVKGVKQGALPPDPCQSMIQRPHNLVSLSSVEDDALGEELEVIWELEPGARIYESSVLPEPSSFDNPERLDAFLDAVRWGAVASLDNRMLQSPFRSGITIEDYQLDPLVRAISMPRVSLLIADDVGLGKTIEAGLVAQELLIRHRARTILIVCPSSIQIQWQEQMRDKFGLDFEIVNSELMSKLRRKRGLNVNPWTHFPRLITSIDFLKRDRPLRLFREVLPVDGQPTYPRTFDLLIVDEAHNIAPSGGDNYAVDSQRTAAIRMISPHFEHKLFLTATPHNGYTSSFTGLLELLDNQRFARGIRPEPTHLGAVMVRRLKSELREDLPMREDGTTQFPEREITPIEVDYSERERRIYKHLADYTKLRRQNCRDRQEEYATEFVLKLLKKRLISCPKAFALTLQQHVESLDSLKRVATKSLGRPSLSVLKKQLEDFSEESFRDEDYDSAEELNVSTATRVFRELTSAEETLLKQLSNYGENEADKVDSKAAALLEWLKTHIKPGGKWCDERVIIFTEYRATQNWLFEVLESSGFADQNRLLTLYGGMDDDTRESVKAAFQANPKDSNVRILLATDAASEGIDLQNHCCRLIHYEIPWNPNRLEQRNGRIDRHGQRSPKAHIYHFVGRGYKVSAFDAGSRPVGDLEGDVEFLMRVVNKVQRIREDLGKVGPVIARQVQEVMVGKLPDLNTQKAEKENEEVKKILKTERKLRDQIAKFREQLNETVGELRLSPQNIKQVVSVGLELANQPPLREVIQPDLAINTKGRQIPSPVFAMPSFAGSWAQCNAGLQHPHTKVIRPIVFDEKTTQGRDDVVLVHLNHRLVQRCLSLLRAEVWSPKAKLSRFTMRTVSRDIVEEPVLVAYGRIVILGGTKERLHEEVIVSGGQINRGKFTRLGVTELNRVLSAISPHVVTDGLKKNLQDAWESYREPLLKALQARMADKKTSMDRVLAEREQKDVKNVSAILDELATHIRRELNQETPEVEQLKLWDIAEVEQFQSDINSLRSRLEKIPREKELEVKAIRARYASPDARLFPLAVACFVPEGWDSL